MKFTYLIAKSNMAAVSSRVAPGISNERLSVFSLILFLLCRAAMLCGSTELDETVPIADADAIAIAIAFVVTVLLACFLDFIVSNEQEVVMGDTTCGMVGMIEGDSSGD